jgi:predicted HTH domain antitoxin
LFKGGANVIVRANVLLAVDAFEKGEASLGKAAEIAGVPVGQMMTLLREFGVKSRIEQEDYLQGLSNLARVW